MEWNTSFETYAPFDQETYETACAIIQDFADLDKAGVVYVDQGGYHMMPLCNDAPDGY